MAKLVFGMNQSLDGYVDHDNPAFAPRPGLFRHWIDQVGQLAGSLYGRKLYDLMRYWDNDQPGWSSDERAFAEAWRRQPKWVVSTTLKSVGSNAELVRGDLEAEVRRLKADVSGEIDVGGPHLAGRLAELGLIDEYRLYLHPVVLGGGRPFFTGPCPPLRLVAHEVVDGDVIRLSYVPS